MKYHYGNVHCTLTKLVPTPKFLIILFLEKEISLSTWDLGYYFFL